MFSPRAVKFFLAAALLAVLMTANGLGYLNAPKGMILSLTQPVFRAAYSLTLSVKGFFYNLATFKSRIEERAALEKKVNQLNAENSVLLEQREENRHLRALLSLKQNAKAAMVAASVVSLDPTGVSDSIIIDRGSADGISRGDAVLDETGNLLGLVREVYQATSQILLLTDGQVKIDAKVAGKEVLGVVSGSHGLGLSLDMVSHDVPVEKGDRIVSSGLTGAMPADILIGYADEQQSDKASLFQKLSVIPAAKMRDFRFVMVVTGF